ncbi:DNA helicase RecQ [soil metagenome]
MLTQTTAKQILKQYYGYENFRPLQEDIIKSITEKKDTLVLMPTGGGKSVCFQIPALLQEGICIVISPLIALMKDQVLALKANGISAAALNSSLSAEDSSQVLRDCVDGKIKLLYLAPERLMSELSFLKSTVQISFIAIDEAHCISAWGHDFRPEYTQLHRIREYFPGIPIIALTATADKITRRDIMLQLKMQEPNVFIASFDRPNISLSVRKGVSGKARIEEIVRFIRSRREEAGIIYCLSRKSTEELAGKLKLEGINAACYHAGLDNSQRDRAQDDFINDRTRVICATIAFGMGIDKSNVRYVIHYNLPKNMEGYYQEIGRCGRDGSKADALLFYNVGDLIMLTQFAQEGKQSELNIAKLQRIQQFAEANNCRRKILLSYFGEAAMEDCGNCDSCKNPKPVFDGTRIAQMALSASTRCNQEIGVNMLVDVLRGSTRSEVMEKNYHTIKTYGAGKEYSFKDWQQFILQLINLGVFEIAFDQGYALKITAFGKEVLTGKQALQLTEVERETVAGKRQRKKRFIEELEAEDNSPQEKLFQQLRQLRLALSKIEKVPPYVIFTDTTLRAMASSLPLTEYELLDVAGVGKRKMELYGGHFLEAIKKFSGHEKSADSEVDDILNPEKDFENDLFRENEERSFIRRENMKLPLEEMQEGAYERRTRKPKVPAAPKVDTYEETFKLYQQGLSIDEIAKERNRVPYTIYGHLARLAETGYAVDISKYINEATIEKVGGVITGDLFEMKDHKPIFDKLNGEFPYHEIQLAIAALKLRSKSK